VLPGLPDEEGRAADRVSDGAFLGWCALSQWNPDYRSASLGYCFDDAAWGHGYATEAARVLQRWAFDTLDLTRFQAEPDTHSVASAGALEQVGFVREGTLREDRVVNSEVSNSWVYGPIGETGGRRPRRFPPAESFLPRVHFHAAPREHRAWSFQSLGSSPVGTSFRRFSDA
jgi:hypothetical protein